MRQLVIIGALTAAAILAVAGWRTSNQASETLLVSRTTPPEAAPLCPWREPEPDLNALFPGATRYEGETHILSGWRVELTERLGRVPSGDENALRLYRVYKQAELLGTILTRRVKGDYGAIEIVVATDTNQVVRGLRLQRLREPESIASALQDPNWQRAFIGKTALDSWHLGGDLPDVAAEARGSAQAVIEGTRSTLVLLAAAEHGASPSLVVTHHH